MFIINDLVLFKQGPDFISPPNRNWVFIEDETRKCGA